MGSCISKCRPKRKTQKEETNNNVQDKLVVSQSSVSPLPPSTQKPFSPSPSPISTSSFSSFSCATSNNSGSSCSSASSRSSSIICSKEGSFSNEFLWSCVKENPHVIGIDTAKGLLDKPQPNRVYVQKLKSPAKATVVQVKQAIPERLARPMVPQKRARASSPTLTRQKSFRKEAPERANSKCSTPIRILRSPYPSRRFNGDNYNHKGGSMDTTKEIFCKRSVISKANLVNYAWKENVRPASPNNIFGKNNGNLRNRDTCTHHIGSKIDEMEVEEIMSSKHMDHPISMEDINNPLIALDCFIFL